MPKVKPKRIYTIYKGKINIKDLLRQIITLNV